MKKVLKWIGIALIAIFLIVLGTVFFLIKKADGLMNQKFAINPPIFQIPSDSLSLIKGKKLASLCIDCHGANLEGHDFFNDPKLGILYAPNLTKGKGGVTSYYNDKDWITSIRHGVRPNGEGLLVMPSHDYYQMSQDDISALISYLKTAPPIDNETGKNRMSVLGKILISIGAFGEINSASQLDHTKGPGSGPQIGVNVAYGEYMVNISGCKSCHGPNLGSGVHPDPNAPSVPNLTSAGNLKNWSDTQFLQTIRTGKTPEGRDLQLKYMPYKSYAGLSDEDLLSIYVYLKNLPAIQEKKK